MNKKLKNILSIFGIIAIIILVFILYVYLTYGAMTAGVILFILFCGGIFIFYVYLDAKYPKRKRDTTMEDAERRKAYAQERGRQEAQEDYDRYKRDVRESEERQRGRDDFMRRIFR